MKTDGKTKKCGICAPKSYSLPWTRQFLFYFYYSRVEMKNTNISAYFVHLLPQPWLIHRVFVCHKSVCLSLKSGRKRSPRKLSQKKNYPERSQGKSSAYFLKSLPRNKPVAENGNKRPQPRIYLHLGLSFYVYRK